MKKPAAKNASTAKTVAKHPKPAAHAKPKASPSVQQQLNKLQSEVTTLKHDITKQKTKAHKSTKQAKAKARSWSPGWSPGWAVGCCVAEALGVTLRLQGLHVTARDVLDLHRRSGADDLDGAPVLAALETASRYGLAGAGLASARECPVDDLALPYGQLPRYWLEHGLAGPAERGRDPFGRGGEREHHLVNAGQLRGDLGREGPVHAGDLVVDDHGLGLFQGHALILGLDLPQAPHVVVATAEGWWSWGELHDLADFPGAVIEEAWVVEWAVAA